MKIYLDVVFLENYIMNYIIIFSTAIISRAKISNFRIGMASIIASFYSIFNYFFYLRNSQSFFIKFIFSFFIIIIAFGKSKFKTFFKQLILFYLVSFTFGGFSFIL